MMKTSKKQNKKSTALLSLFLANYPGKSRFAESYRTLRTNIELSFLDKDLNCLLVTSAGEAEGKTLTVANYAYNLAEAGKTVLMVDADLRKPSLSRLLRKKDASGLTGLLSSLLGTQVQQGPLDQTSPSDLIRLLQLQKKTGQLTVSSKDNSRTFQLLFINGKMSDCVWENCPSERSLGSNLVRQGIITSQQAVQASIRAQETGQKFGLVLTNAGIVSWKQLNPFVNNHLSHCLRVLLNIDEGSYSFKEIPRFKLDGIRYTVDLESIYNNLVTTSERMPFINAGIKSALLQTPQEGLFLLPSGLIPPNPSELLGSERMVFLLARLKELFNVVILDSPPLLPTSDALALAPHVDGVIFVIKAGGINRDLIKKACEQLEHAKAHVVGAVLNSVDVHREGYYKYYEKYYSHYYGT